MRDGARLAFAILLELAAFAAGAQNAPGAPRSPAAGVAGAVELDLKPLPLYGADIRSLAFDPADPERAFAGTSAGHVYRSDDGGATFRNAGVEIPFPGWVVAALVFDDNRPGRLWAGLWGIWGGGIVAFSDDAAANWTVRRVNAGDNAQVYALATVPGVPDRLFAGTRAGVEVSDDGGQTFRPLGRDLPGLIHVSSLHIDRERPEVVLAGTWRRAYRSEDGGLTWQGIFDGMVLDTEVFSLHAAADRPGEIWASTCGWIYRGDALGAKWSRFTNGLAEKRTPSFAVLPGERLLAGTVAGAFLSTDRGASFRRTTPDSLAVLAIAWHPARPDHILIGTEGAGIWSSSDGGETFAARPVGMRNLRVPALDVDGDHLFAAVAHAGPASGIYRSPDGGNSFEPLPSELPTVLAMATAGGRLFVATERGLFERERTAPEASAKSRGNGAPAVFDEALPARFRRLPELGEQRVEQLVVEAGRVVARVHEALFELRPGGAGAGAAAGFQPVALGKAGAAGKGARPVLRSIALVGGELWILRDDGLARLAGGKVQAASLPYPAAAGSELAAARGELLYSGRGGLYRRAAASGEWKLLRGGPVRTLQTGSTLFPLLVESLGSLALLEAGDGVWWSITPPYPARETLSALVSDGRLLLGSSGFGIWQAQLPVAAARSGRAGSAGPEPAAGAQRSSSSEARIRR